MIISRSVPTLIGALFVSLFSAASSTAQIPRINTFYPIGGRIGTTVDLEIRGSGLNGANKLMVHGAGLTGTVAPSGSKQDEAAKPVWQAKCGSCHELRSPANRSMTPDQWTATVDRMIRVRNAPINPADSDKIKQYLAGAAKSGNLTATVKIASDALPGVYEMRVVTPVGVSTASLFEVGNLPEVTAVNNTRNTPVALSFPCVVNGSINGLPNGSAERHYFRFQGKSGERVVFNLKAYRYNFLTQLFFNPDLRIYDSSGTEIAENHGYYELDPLIDWKCPTNGSYTLEVRDLLGKGNPGNVYRMTVGELPYDTMVYPPAVQAGSSETVRLVGKDTDGTDTSFTVPSINSLGLTSVGSPYGAQEIYVSGFPVFGKDKTVVAPACMTGRLTKPGDSDIFTIQGDGTYDFEAYSERLGSSVPVRCRLLNNKGQSIAKSDRDERMTAKLENGKSYTMKVEPVYAVDQMECVYAVEARPIHPIADVAIRPANITIRPGMSTAAEVVLLRREDIAGDITVSADNLPPGVIVTPAIIQPDRNEARLIITAMPSAAPSERPITITVSAQGPAGEVRSAAQPQEIVLVQNNPTPIIRSECILAVRGQSDFTGEVTSGKVIKVHPRKGVKVVVKITRKSSFAAAVNVKLTGLPSGWVANQEQIPANKDTVTLLVRPDGNNTEPFLKRDPKLSPIYATVEMGPDEYMFVVASMLVNRADVITDKDDDKN